MIWLALVQVVTGCVIYLIIRHVDQQQKVIGRQISRTVDATAELAVQHTALTKSVLELSILVNAMLEAEESKS